MKRYEEVLNVFHDGVATRAINFICRHLDRVNFRMMFTIRNPIWIASYVSNVPFLFRSTPLHVHFDLHCT